MRKDMAKVIVERPRLKGWGSRKGRPLDFDDLPSHAGMRRHHKLHGGWKLLNENLAPLRRYLFKQVGRPWNKVYSEISANLRADNPVQQHVRDHLTDFVAVKPRRQKDHWRNWQKNGLWHQPLYVDPVTGLLCRTDRLSEEKTRLRAEREARRQVRRN